MMRPLLNQQIIISETQNLQTIYQLYDILKKYIPQVDTSREVVRIPQYPYVFMNAKKLSLAVNTVDFQSQSNLFIEKDVYLHSANM